MQKNTKYPPNTKLHAARIERSWTQEDVEEKIEVPHGSFGRWERGEVFPSAYTRKQLCRIFEKTLDELGLIPQEMQATLPPAPLEHDSTRNELQPSAPLPAITTQSPTHRQSRISRQYLVTGITASLVLVSILGFFSVHSFMTTGHPGGVWISPSNGAIVHDTMHIAAYAYPMHNNAPTIAYVNFTLAWAGSDPHQWLIACHLTAPVHIDTFQCNIQLHQLGVPAGQVRVSFDVCDQAGNIHDAPNGIHDVVYIPTASTFSA